MRISPFAYCAAGHVRSTGSLPHAQSAMHQPIPNTCLRVGQVVVDVVDGGPHVRLGRHVQGDDVHSAG
jgi:hypothetical protein